VFAVALAVGLGAYLFTKQTPQAAVPATNVQNPQATSPASGVNVGQTFPAFRITNADGQTVTNASLRGRPAIIWYTTSYCAPCQVGARAVAKLYDQLGGNAFKVLVVFVDPGESAATLDQWRSQFGRPGWIVALDKDGSLSKDVGLQYLDSKYLLDANGVVRNADFTVADDRYLAVIRSVVESKGQ